MKTHKNILILDDHILVATAIASQLMPYFHVFPVTDVAEMRETMATTKIDAAVIDLALNEGDSYGQRLIPEFRQDGIPVLVYSCKSDQADYCKELGASGFVHKNSAPVDFRVLIDTLLAGGQCFPAKRGRSAIRTFQERLDTLTKTERIVFEHYILNETFQVIAQKLDKKLSTVSNLGSIILSKFAKKNRTALILYAVAEGHITADMPVAPLDETGDSAPRKAIPRRVRTKKL